MMKIFKFRNLILLCAVLFLAACDNDDDAPTNGTISLTPQAAQYDGLRGTDVTVTVTAAAEDGILTVKAKPEIGDEEDFTIPADATTFEATYTFSIPGNAALNTSYNVTFELVDKNNQTTSQDVSVNASVKAIDTTPSTYDFTRNGSTTVSYSGQIERLNMVAEIKAYLQGGDAGNAVSAQVLKDAYNNVGDNGNGFFSFTSTKQLGDKTFQPDLDNRLMESLFEAAEAASQTGVTASSGQAGLITRENKGSTVLVDENGREFTQFVEKGLMGTVMYNQIFNTYFTDGRIGNDVENTALRDGKNYTDMEHHWDEAFGYFNPPVDFTTPWPDAREPELVYWANYSNVVDPFLNTNGAVMEAFIEGRTAIVNNDFDTRDAQRDILFEQLELVTAATAVHYINQTLGHLNDGNTGEAFHSLSEAWAFVNAIKYSPRRKLDLAAIDTINETDFGENGNFWNVTVAGLNKAKSTLVSTYPEMDPVKDSL
ncbi:MAG: DUF4856 domain-containing protein [Bacteroidota bacterium]